MVKLPDEFIDTQYPGYFFNITNQRLYSLKIDGVLKPLKFIRPNRFNHINNCPVKLADGSRVWSEGGYYVSVEGRKRFYPVEALQLLPHSDSIIPVKKQD